MDSDTLELIFKARDEASQVVNNLRAALDSIPAAAEHIRTATDEIAAAFQTLKVSTTASINAQKEAINAAYLQIRNSGTSTADEIKRAEAARAKAVEDLDRQNFATRKGLLDTFKDHWVAVTGVIIGAWASISEAKEYLNIGAAAMQAEESFKQVTDAYGVDGDRLLAKLKEVSVGAIDESAMMQRAVKALQQGLSPDQIVHLMEVARSSARVAGTDIASAFDRITEATANQMTRGLKSLGIVIDQNKAFEDYANKLGIAKDALNEQQQSQALADAAIEEGLRQRSKMNIALVNENEQLQINKARIEEMKESIGKELVNVLAAAAGNLDAIGIALSAAAIYNAPKAIGAIIASFEGLSIASGAAAMVMKSSLVAAAAVIGFELGKVIDKLTYDLANIDLSGMNRPLAETAKTQKELEKNTAELNARLAELGFTGPDAWQKYERAVKAGIVVTDQITGKQSNLLEQMKQAGAVWAAQGKTMEAQSKLFLDLIKEDFEKGQITMEAYVAYATAAQEKATKDQIAQAELRKEEIRKEQEMRVISADEAKAKIAVVEEEIKQIRINAAIETRHIDEEAAKIRDQGIEERQKEEEEAFTNWKNLQDLKLQTLKGQIDLESAVEDAAVKRGEMTQSEALERKLAREKEYYAQEIALATDTANQIAQRTGLNTEKDIAEYEEAMQKKEQLQLEFQAAVVKSEQEIADAQQKETEGVAQVAEDTSQKVLEAFTTQVKDVVATAEQMVGYYKALSVNIMSRPDGWENIIGYWTTFFRDRIKETYGDIISTIQDAVGTVKGTFEDLSAMGITSVGQASQLLKSLASSASTDIVAFYSQMKQLGQETTEAVGMTAQEWVQKVAEYVNYVKGLLMSLKDQIATYQDELDQLRGNDTAILERWYAKEKEKLEEKYKDQLGSSKEYYEALALLDAIYAEKKKNVLDDLKQKEDEYFGGGATEESGGGAAGSPAGSLAVTPKVVFPPGMANPFVQFADDVKKNLELHVQNTIGAIQQAFGEGVKMSPQEISLKKEISLDTVFTIKALDNDSVVKVAKEVIFPEWEKYLRLKGIDLAKLVTT